MFSVAARRRLLVAAKHGASQESAASDGSDAGRVFWHWQRNSARYAARNAAVRRREVPVSDALRRLPMIYGGHDLGPRPETRQRVGEALASGADVVSVIKRVAAGVSELWDACVVALPETEPRPACARGCAWCCHQRVEITAPEAFVIARGLVADAVLQSGLRPVLDATAQRHAALSSKQQFAAQSACPFLDRGGGCSIYDTRPIACRRAHSLDAEVCRELARDPARQLRVPTSEALDWNTSALVLGGYEGMAHAGVPPHQYELAQAVSLALAVPDAEQRWRNGEDVLAPALTRHADELVRLFG